MAKPFAKGFYKSKAWEDCRKAYIQHRITIDGGMCERCHKNIGYIVHHKIWLNSVNIQDPMVALNADNLEYLCLSCHSELHNGFHHGERKTILCVFDEKGRPIGRTTASN